MRFFIVILNYCSWQDTLECIDSLSKSSCSDFNIIVIDNASPNNSVSRIEDYFNCLDQNYVYDEKIRFISIDIQEGWVGANKVFESIFSLNKGLSLFKYPILFLKSNKNLGFAGGNNLALNSLINSTMISDRDKVFLLNPDTTVAPNAIEKLVLIDDDEFVAACKIKNYQTRKDEFLGCYTLNPYLGSQIARAMVNGYQQNDLAANNTIMSCVKHFALYGAPEAGRDYNTVDMSRIRMYNEYLPPYKAAVEEGVGSVMASFNEIDGVPATGNKWLLTDLLRDDWGFDGFVVSDYTGIYEMRAHGMGDGVDVTSLALKAGLDMDMAGDAPGIDAAFIKNLKTALDEGKISITDIDTAVKRILTAKYQLGLFDDPYKYCDLDREKATLGKQEFHDAVLDVAQKSIVLLKNENNLLPLKKGNQKIAVIGALANDKTSPLGSWRIAAKDETAVSVLEGLKHYNGNEIVYAKGADVSTGETVFAKLEDITIPVDVVNVFRPSKEAPIFAEQTVKIGAKVLWLQFGIQNQKAQEIVELANITYIANRCIKQEYQKFFLKINPVFPALLTD